MTYTIYSRTTDRPLFDTDNEELAQQALCDGHRVGRNLFGCEVEWTGTNLYRTNMRLTSLRVSG